MSVQVTNKIRNPKTWTWMDIWSAEATDENNYTITPSSKWKISADNLLNIPVNKIDDNNYSDSNNVQQTQKNVTITTPTDEPLEGRHIAITNQDGSISEWAKIRSSASSNQFLNEQGQWITPTHPNYTLEIGNSNNSKKVPIFLKKDDNITSYFYLEAGNGLQFTSIEPSNKLLQISASISNLQDLSDVPSNPDKGQLLRTNDTDGSLEWKTPIMKEEHRFDFIAPRWGHGTFDEGTTINSYAILPRYDSSWDTNNEVGSGADKTHAYRLIINQKEIFKYMLQWQ